MKKKSQKTQKRKIDDALHYFSSNPHGDIADSTSALCQGDISDDYYYIA
jgi:hypothetical protein